MYRDFIVDYMLNSNIRCIEIYMQATNDLKKKQLNSNIRCIEILYSCSAHNDRRIVE